MRKLWITGCIVMICMGMLTACGGNKTEVVPIGDTEEADREVPYAMYINRVEGGKASVTISNYTDEEILYGTDFHLQKYIGSDWVDVSGLFHSGAQQRGHGCQMGVAVQHADGWGIYADEDSA